MLLLVLRFLQGLGLGGEWGGAVLLTAEHAPAERRGLWSSFPQIGPAVGFLLANGVMLALSAALTEAQFAAWGWRVPFWAAGVLAAGGAVAAVVARREPRVSWRSTTTRACRSPRWCATTGGWCC